MQLIFRGRVKAANDSLKFRQYKKNCSGSDSRTCAGVYANLDRRIYTLC